MTGFLSDAALAHLQDVADWPDAGQRYEITGRLGRGGMGIVYSARDRTLDREVALKIIDDVEASAAAAERLQAEARILGRLEHPGIVPVHDAGRLADGRVFYVMKLVRGERLDRVLESRPLKERLDLFLRICDAVSFAHAHGIVHRDLKPQNVMLGPFGEVLVMDWGAAVQQAALVGDGGIVGTPGFMAPEQRAGGAIDARTDVYALGVVLETLVPTPAPRPLCAIARRARADQPELRYESVERLARDVRRFRDGEPVEAYRETAWERVRRVSSRHKVPITLVLVYMTVRVILLLWFRT